jgi:hypothetical protein
MGEYDNKARSRLQVGKRAFNDYLLTVIIVLYG